MINLCSMISVCCSRLREGKGAKYVGASLVHSTSNPLLLSLAESHKYGSTFTDEETEALGSEVHCSLQSDPGL